MDSDEHLVPATTFHVVRLWTQQCARPNPTRYDFKTYMSSLGLLDDADETTQPNGFSLWKFRIVDPHVWTLACIRYGF